MRRRTPREKKDLEYTKDHINNSEYPHAFRRNWPRKKARAHRAYRREVRSLLTSLKARQEADLPEKIDPETVRRPRVRKWGVIPYGEVVKYRPIIRIERMGYNFFRHDYDSSRDRESFAGFLASQIGGRTEKSRKLAMYLWSWLDLSQRPVHLRQRYLWDYRWERKHNWLHAFFKDEPELEERVRVWISSFETQ